MRAPLRKLAVCAVAAAAAGCADGVPPIIDWQGPLAECSASEPCSDGFTCVEGICVADAPEDAGPSGEDAGGHTATEEDASMEPIGRLDATAIPVHPSTEDEDAGAANDANAGGGDANADAAGSGAASDAGSDSGSSFSASSDDSRSDTSSSSDTKDDSGSDAPAAAFEAAAAS